MSNESEFPKLHDWCDPNNAAIVALQAKGRNALYELNHKEPDERDLELFAQIFGGIGSGTRIRAPFDADFGCHVVLGHDGFWNTGGVVLDWGNIVIGDRFNIGPRVQILAVTHPVNPRERAGRLMVKGLDVTIGDDVWIGGNVTIYGGVKIGHGAIVQANAVVTKDVPAFTIVAGTPAKQVGQVPDDPEYEQFRLAKRAEYAARQAT